MTSPDLVALAAAVLHARRDPERVLEVACGDGERTLFLAREYPGARVRGVDASEEAIEAATARVGLDPEGRIAFKVARPGSLPFPDSHFDLVVRRLSHGMADKVAARGDRRAIARVLRPGGELIEFAAERPRDPLGLRGELAGRRRRKHGFVPLQSGGAGGGIYIVARLR